MKTLGLLLLLSLDIVIFNCEAQGTWAQKADFGGIGRENAVGFSINGKGYIGTGGSIISVGKSFWQYDPSTDTWTQEADLPGEGRENAIGFSIGDKGYVGTGRTSDNSYTDDFWQYDPDINEWTQKASFGGGQRGFAFSFAVDGKGYVGGGGNGTHYTKDFWEYDPVSDIWTKKANYGGGPIALCAAFTIGDKAYVGTGLDNNISFRKDFWEYEPASGMWTQKGDFPGDARYGSVAFTINSLGYVGLGTTFNTSFADLWQYEPLTDNWIQKADFPGGGAGDRVGFAIGNYGYVGTGGAAEKQFWQYTPDCTPPIGLTATNITNSKATLSWNAVSGAVKYKVRYRVSGNNPWTNVGSTTTTKKINELTAGTTYQWQVRTVCSIDPSISSDWSTKQNFTTSLRLSHEEESAILTVYPNPFSSSTILSFSIEENSHAIIEVFDLAGRKFTTLLDENLEAGDHHVMLNLEQLAQGIYLLTLKMNDQSSTMKIVVE